MLLKTEKTNQQSLSFSLESTLDNKHTLFLPKQQ